jgi:hypothetical protein
MSVASLSTLAAAFDLTDSDVEFEGDRLGRQVQRMASRWKAAGTPETKVRRALRKLASRHHVDMPSRDGLAQLLNRMGDASWWRRALRKRLRIVEHHAIQRGTVHRRASPYVSEKSLRRFDADRRRVAELIAGLELMNAGTGEVLPLEDVVAASQANPANRRRAMMARIKGVELAALAKGHEALFLTITAPSRMHARHSVSGLANERHDGSSPRQVQSYLHGVWRRAMRSLQRDGLAAYGLRTVEPHHDGCPHWHVLMFAASSQVDAILATLRTHALADSPNEPGAQARRFVVERIDPSKGGAAAYVAKYVSKSIDGEGVDRDNETSETGANTARRIVAWARRWGIRQFQFYGLPPITPMRELYRLDGEDLASAGLAAAHTACKANDYASYLAACEAHDVRLSVQYVERPSTRYADEVSRAIRGLFARAIDLGAPLELITRTEKWVIQTRKREPVGADFEPPWTRFNNCAGPMKSTTCDLPGRDSAAGQARLPNHHKRPPVRTAKGRPEWPQVERNSREETTC